MSMTPPAPGTPNLVRKVTNGLCPLWYYHQGSSMTSSRIEPT